MVKVARFFDSRCTYIICQPTRYVQMPLAAKTIAADLGSVLCIKLGACYRLGHLAADYRAWMKVFDMQ